MSQEKRVGFGPSYRREPFDWDPKPTEVPEGKKVLTEVHQIVAETTIHQEIGVETGPVPPAAPEIGPGDQTGATPEAQDAEPNPATPATLGDLTEEITREARLRREGDHRLGEQVEKSRRKAEAARNRAEAARNETRIIADGAIASADRSEAGARRSEDAATRAERAVNPELSEEEWQLKLRDLFIKHNTNTNEEKEILLGELLDEERLSDRNRETLNNRIRIERQKLISVLSQILDKKTSLVEPKPPIEQKHNPPPEEVVVPEQTVTPIPIPPTAGAEDIGPGPKKDKKLDKIKKAVGKHRGKIILGAIGTGLVVAAVIFAARSGDSSPTSGPDATPTPSSASGEPTPRPTATVAATAEPTARPKPTETSIAPRGERLKSLDVVFREQGPTAWLKAAGFTFRSLELDARQPEETILGNKIVATGFQVEVEGLNVNWPAGLTTDQPVDGNCVKPDPNNPSQVCTNVRGFTGRATLYGDIQNWGQLAPKK